MKPIVCYVQASDGSPLMPCRSHGRVKRMLKAGKAHIVSKVPFTIRLDYESGHETDMVILGEDPGRTNIGLCAIDSKGRVLYASDIRTRNKAICKLMLDRKKARQASRQGERKRRQRRAVKNGTAFPEEIPMIATGMEFFQSGMGKRPETVETGWRERTLPKCRKPVRVKNIRNSESKFCNRKRQKGWLTPTANQLLLTHENAIRKVMRILPVSCIVLELNRFTFARMENPDIKNWEYQFGPLYGFDSVEEAVSAQQHGKCLFCQKAIDRYHHIVPKALGGSDALPNRAGLCKGHHTKVHTERIWYEKLLKKKAGLEKKYAALSALNQVIPHLLNWLLGMGQSMDVRITSGYRTMMVRDSFGLDKDHYIDAFCIAASALIGGDVDIPEFGKVYHMVQYRRHDRAIIQRTEGRKYKLDGKTVAVNRHKATVAEPQPDGTVQQKGQTGDSLEEFRLKMAEKHGAREADRIISRLEAVKSKRVYRTKGRTMPGAILDGPDGRFVLHGQHNQCTRYQNEEAVLEGKKPKAYREYQKNVCSLVLHNAGLVYLQSV